MAGEDPVAVDAAASALMGVNSKHVRQILLASREGVGNSNFSPVGDFLYFKNRFPKRSLKDNLRETVAGVYLRFFHET
jgi:uncharacterized protein (DUF362 family)